MEQARRDSVRFGEFELDLRAGELRCGDARIPLQEKPFQFLALLLSRTGDVVSREELIQSLWPAGTHVDYEAGLNTAVKKVRAALGDSAQHPVFIETVGRRGYRFIASVDGGKRVLQPRARHVRAAIVIGLVIVAAALVGMMVIQQKGRQPDLPPPIRSLLVLPIIGSGAPAIDEYFVDGLTDQLIANLGRTPSLRVISRESSMRYKGADAPVQKVAQELDVDAVVIGKLSRTSSRVRINLEIVDARTNTRAWTHTYDTTIDDLFGLQEQMTIDVLRQIGARRRSTFKPAEPPNSRAYLLYMRGRYEWNRVPPNYAEAMLFFQQAADEDARLAIAYAGLADCYATRRFWGVGTNTRNDDIRQAKALAKQALQIDANVGEAYATLGSVADDEYDFAAAEAAFPMAIKLAPSLAYARGWYALHLARLGRFDEAIAQARIGLKLDPQSWFPITFLARVLTLAGRNAEAMEALTTQATLYPRARSHLSAFLVKHRLGDVAGAVDELTRVHASTGEENITIRRAYERAGFEAAVRAAIHEIETRDPHPPQWNIALLSAVLEDSEGTVRALERSYRLGETDFGYVNVCPEIAFVRNDPRVAAMIQAIKLRQ